MIIDTEAHDIMNFRPLINSYGTTVEGNYIAFYHEDRLYSVRNTLTGIISLVYAKSPHSAIERIREGELSNE